MIICHGFSFSCFQVWIHDQPILTGYNSECLLMIFLWLFYPLTGLCSGLRSLKGDQSWVFIGRTDAKDETPILWLPHAKSWPIGKDPDSGRDWGQEEKGTTEDEMAGWHHWLDGRQSGWTLGVGDGQGGLACCDSWGRKESDMTEQWNWTELNWMKVFQDSSSFSFPKLKKGISTNKWISCYKLEDLRK